MIQRIRPLILVALIISGCAPVVPSSQELLQRQAKQELKLAAKKSLTTEERAVSYLSAAKNAASLFGGEPISESARLVYNKAAADLTVMLRSSADGGLWNRTQTLSSGGVTYRLRFAPGTRSGVWDPAFFSSFVPASSVKQGSFDRRNLQHGLGGALVGIHQTDPPEPFANRAGVTAAVTAVLDFEGSDVTLSLIDPTARTATRIAGRNLILEADFTAPLAYLPQDSEIWEGLRGALFAADVMGTTGLYKSQPYDADRIPLILVHGLISTPRMWRNVINELEADPVIRRHYQPWVFAYPTGNPPLYSALRLREELEKFHRLYPKSPGYVMVGHSMGGLLTHLQLTSMKRRHWDTIGKEGAGDFFANVQEGDLVARATLFEANPHIDRAVFICTPHRGSHMARGRIGSLGRRLIRLPGSIATSLADTVGSSVAIVTGDPNRLPNSVDGLAPDNPALKVLDTRPIRAPHHSIIGDRGRGDTSKSSDGVVEHWSSHLKTAKSEKIVPASHAAVEHPETINELRRLLHLHLEEN